MVGKAQKSHGARSGLYDGCPNGVPPIHLFQVEQEFNSDFIPSSTFSRGEQSVARSAWLAKRGTSKKRPSPHLQKVPTRNNKVSARTLQTALVLFNS
jgi:hypothetical protein